MAVLNNIEKKERKRELTVKQQSFLKNLVETQGDAKEAAKLAGYSSPYYHVVKSLKSEILELTKEVLATSAPKAAFKLVEIMESKKPIIQANNKLAAAQTLLDRVGDHRLRLTPPLGLNVIKWLLHITRNNLAG